MKIGAKSIGKKERCFIIAEAGVNHNGDLGRALEMIDCAAVAGVDAIKFQTFNSKLLVSFDAQQADYQKKNTGKQETQFEMLKALELPKSGYGQLIDKCNNNQLIFLSTPFDHESVDFLDSLPIDAYKISSGEISNIPLVRDIASRHKPIIMSTGMSSIQDIEKAVGAIRMSGNSDCVLLQCTSNYPASPENVNLKVMETLRREFGLPVGFSDHTLGIEVSIAAVALGACVIEKHFTLDKSLPGPDHIMSLEPDELKNLVECIRNVEKSIGTGKKEIAPCERNISNVAKKSIYYKHDILPGALLRENDVIMLRPGDGLPPSMLHEFIGRKLSKKVFSGTKMNAADFDN